MIDFDKIVKKVGKKGGNVLLKEDIFEIIDPEKQQKFQKKVDTIIYRMKAQKMLIPLKSGVYIVPSGEDSGLLHADLLEKYYPKLLKKYITYHVGSQYCIAGKKSLEMHMKDFSIPEKVTIITRNLNKKIKVGAYHIIFKTISGKDSGKKINLFSRIFSSITEKNLEGISFKITGLEISLLEASLMQEVYQGIPLDLLVRVIKKYQNNFDQTIFQEIGKYKYIMSMNRLKEISKPLNKELYSVFLDVIKKNGGLFIGEGVRGI
ncbi:MAG: hypothetical protein GY828_00845 [Candidatus Gracilibacteria bacterium]|nr:hypothetical protein [Candidatus Gracilibacteria bacterium]